MIQKISYPKNLTHKILVLFILELVFIVPLIYSNLTLDIFLVLKFQTILLLCGFCLAFYLLSNRNQTIAESVQNSSRAITHPTKLTLSKSFLFSNPILLPTLVYLFSSGFSLFFAECPEIAWRSFFILFMLALTSIIISQNSEAFEKIIKILVISATVVSCAGILQIFSIGAFKPICDGYGIFTYGSTVGHSNFAAQFIVGIVPLALMLSLFREQRRSFPRVTQIIYVILLLIIGTYLLVIFVRGAWFGLFIAFLFLLISLFLLNQKRNFPWRSFIIIFLLAAILLGSISLIYQDPEGYNAWRKLKSAGDLDKDSSRFRVLLWQGVLKMIRAKPWTGVGIGHFGISYPLYREPAERKHSGSNIEVVQAHNDFLHTAAETGLIGLFSFLWLIFAAMKKGWQDTFKKLKTWEPDEANYLEPKTTRIEAYKPLFLATSLIAILAHSLVCFPLQSPSSLMLFWVLLGLLAAPSFTPKKRTKLKTYSKTRLSYLLTILVLILSILLASAPLASNYYLKKAFYLVDQKKPQEAIEYLNKAQHAYPFDHEVYFLRARLWTFLGLYRLAVMDNWQCLKFRPYYRNAWYNLGLSYFFMQDYHNAYLSFNRCLELDQNFADAYNNLGNVCLTLGNFGEAKTNFQKAVEINPTHEGYRYNLKMVKEAISKSK